MNTVNPYVSNKAAYHRHSLNLLRVGSQPFPVHVQIILSDLCNHSCSFCAYRWDGYTTNELFYVLGQDGEKNHNPNRMLPTAKVLEILDDCVRMGVKAIQYTGGGEPTVHPDHKHIFEETLKRGLEYSLVTNGTRWVSGIEGTLAKATWVRFSLDAGKPSTYAKIRSISPERFYDCLYHVDKLSRKKRDLGTDVYIGVGFVVTKDNWTEVVEAAQLAKQAGANSFRISAVFQPDDGAYFSEFFEQAASLCKEAESLTNDTFKVSNMFGDRLDDLNQTHPEYSTCSIQQFVTYIGGDMNVYRCCNLAYNPRGLIGSLKDQTFYDLWTGKEKQDDFGTFDATGCPRCQFNAKNRAILEMLDHPASDSQVADKQLPAHVNFV